METWADWLHSVFSEEEFQRDFSRVLFFNDCREVWLQGEIARRWAALASSNAGDPLQIGGGLPTGGKKFDLQHGSGRNRFLAEIKVIGTHHENKMLFAGATKGTIKKFLHTKCTDDGLWYRQRYTPITNENSLLRDVYALRQIQKCKERLMILVISFDLYSE